MMGTPPLLAAAERTETWLARPSVVLVHLLETWNAPTYVGYSFQCWGFFTVSGAQAYARIHSLGRCYIASQAPGILTGNGRCAVRKRKPRQKRQAVPA